MKFSFILSLTMLFLVALASCAPLVAWFGMVTPIGGLCLLAGWLSLALGVSRPR